MSEKKPKPTHVRSRNGQLYDIRPGYFRAGRPRGGHEEADAGERPEREADPDATEGREKENSAVSVEKFYKRFAPGPGKVEIISNAPGGNYVHKVLMAIESTDLQGAGIVIPHISHDDSCGIWVRSEPRPPCDCNPDIVIHTEKSDCTEGPCGVLKREGRLTSGHVRGRSGK